ncbi:MAG: hypothetical protein PHF17_05170 [Arcobacteraceae bacterium]|nr:hypothetical protein [Arcobacteraceae bacterium]
MIKKFISTGLLIASISIFSGCGDVKQPSLSDAVKGSFKISNGMSIDEVEKIMIIEPTGREKMGDIIIYKYEGDTTTGEDETLKVTYNNVIIKFQNDKVIHSGTFSCEVPQVKKD